MKSKLIIIVLSLFALVLTACGPSGPGPADELAQCLTDSGAVMYGTNWCQFCNQQKEMFGSSFKEINFVDCDVYRDACIKAGVKGYPTWQVNGANYEGVQSLYDLAQNSGCSVTGENTQPA
jgi:hypothetical protein